MKRTLTLPPDVRLIFFALSLVVMGTPVLLAAPPLAQNSSTNSTVIDVAPPFAGGANAGKNISLASLRGKPVLLVIASSPKDRSFRKQMKELRGHYERLAAQGLICFAAFTSEGGRIPSNIPFILVNDPASTSAAYDVAQGFAVVMIGRDGNLDCLSTRPLPGYRIVDLVNNNAEMQTLLRR